MFRVIWMVFCFEFLIGIMLKLVLFVFIFWNIFLMFVNGRFSVEWLKCLSMVCWLNVFFGLR